MGIATDTTTTKKADTTAPQFHPNPKTSDVV